jgi:hypothetical protein
VTRSRPLEAPGHLGRGPCQPWSRRGIPLRQYPPRHQVVHRGRRSQLALGRDGHGEQQGGCSRGPEGGCLCATRSVPSSSSRSHPWPTAPTRCSRRPGPPRSAHPRCQRRHRRGRPRDQGRSAPGAGPRLGDRLLWPEVPRLLRRCRPPALGVIGQAASGRLSALAQSPSSSTGIPTGQKVPSEVGEECSRRPVMAAPVHVRWRSGWLVSVGTSIQQPAGDGGTGGGGRA